MLKFKSFLQEAKNRCWKGYKPTPGKKAYAKGSCIKEDDILDEENLIQVECIS